MANENAQTVKVLQEKIEELQRQIQLLATKKIGSPHYRTPPKLLNAKRLPDDGRRYYRVWYEWLEKNGFQFIERGGWVLACELWSMQSGDDELVMLELLEGPKAGERTRELRSFLIQAQYQ